MREEGGNYASTEKWSAVRAFAIAKSLHGVSEFAVRFPPSADSSHRRAATRKTLDP